MCTHTAATPCSTKNSCLLAGSRHFVYAGMHLFYIILALDERVQRILRLSVQSHPFMLA